MYENDFTFKENLNEEKKENRMVCEQLEYSRYKLLTEKFLDISKELYHWNKYKCRQEGEQLRSINLTKISNEGKLKYTDIDEHSYLDVSSFRRKDNLW